MTTTTDITSAKVATIEEVNQQLPTFADLLPAQAKPYWEIIQTYPVAEAVIIFLLFYALAFILRNYAIALLHRLTQKTDTTFDDEIIDELKRPIFNLVVWLGVIIATRSAGWYEGAAAYIAPMVLTIMVLIATRASLSISSTVISALSRDDNRFQSIDLRTEPLLVISSKILILLVSAYTVLMIWGINPVGLLASAGVVGIAVGFAAKDTLANLFSGVFILADRPYKLGDYINLSSGERGKVTHIGIRSTRILTRDDIEVTVPNGVIGNGKVVNESGGSHLKMRIRLALECSYDADLDKVEKVLMQVAHDHGDICDHPAPRVRFRGFGDSGIQVQLLGWIDEPELRGRVTHLLVKEIHAAFRDNGLVIPYPQRDVHLVKAAD
ncbi:MAG: mechanosensitive ion channel family protein [Pseudomonadota bacterium]